jgi:rod shape-determining protein MreC
VQVARSGLRTIAYGTGHSDRLLLPNVPQSGDIRRGDLLISSGLGGRFPAGFPVGTVTALQADKLRLFVTADATPAAHLERGSEVLLVNNRPAPVDVGPPASPHANQPGPQDEAVTDAAHATPGKATPAKPGSAPAASTSQPAASAAKPAPASEPAAPAPKPAAEPSR